MFAGAVGPEDREIEVRLGKIDPAVGGHQSEAHVGCLLAVAREPRREPFRGQVARRRDRQRLRRLDRLHRAHRFLELQETLPQRIEPGIRSEEHTSELQSLMRNSYDVFCLKTKKEKNKLE